MWILSQPKFTLRDNFITGNAYMCIEMNAHALLMLAFILRDKAHSNTNNFLPWMCGSQSCERMFCALRSMTGTFSTIITFNMLGLLSQLHKLYIQEELQSEASKSEHGIGFPRQEKFGRRKDGTSNYQSFSLSEISKFYRYFGKGTAKGYRESMETLGMGR